MQWSLYYGVTCRKQQSFYCITLCVPLRQVSLLRQTCLEGTPQRNKCVTGLKTYTGIIISEQYVPLWGIYAGETEKPYGMQNTGMKTIAIVLDRLKCFKFV